MRVDANPATQFHRYQQANEQTQPSGRYRDLLSAPEAAKGDTLELSEASRALTANGKNAASPAHRARELMETYEELGNMKFGKLVSSTARGEDPVALYTTPPAEPAPVSAEEGGALDGQETGDEAGSDGTTGGAVAAPAPEETPSPETDDTLIVEVPVLAETGAAQHEGLLQTDLLDSLMDVEPDPPAS